MIKVENVSKVYPLRQSRIDEEGNNIDQHWALKDVSFEIKKGESVGIIGPNGSGKSTLLKILAGVTKPSSGTVTIRGKIASILDIGAGFHPELSGRENVFLNGQIHGFSKNQITAKFDEILLFSGIEKFIDEPVKNYSNGMYLRLAFSIMVHLDFDVYLFDEVFSVGDAKFGLKTNKKFKELLDSNKTILFVSHNFSELTNLDQYINLQSGKISEKTKSTNLLSRYIEETVLNDGIDLQTKNIKISDFSNYPTSKYFTIKEIFFHQGMDSDEEFVSDKPFFLDINFEKNTNESTIDPILNLTDSVGSSILISSTIISGRPISESMKGNYIVRCIIPENWLSNKIYCINLSFFQNAETLINSISEVKLSMKDVEKIQEEIEFKMALNLERLIYFKPKMFLMNKFNLEMLNLSNSLLTPLFNWEITSKQ